MDVGLIDAIIGLMFVIGMIALAQRSDTRKKQENEEQVARDVLLNHTEVRSLWDNGRIDHAILGGIDEEHILFTLGTVRALWLKYAASAWLGYEEFGRGFMLLNRHTWKVSYYALPPKHVFNQLPVEIADYCHQYDPRTELVIAIYGYPDKGFSDAAAALWVRPPATWLMPPAAARQWKPS